MHHVLPQWALDQVAASINHDLADSDDSALQALAKALHRELHAYARSVRCDYDEARH